MQGVGLERVLFSNDWNVVDYVIGILILLQKTGLQGAVGVQPGPAVLPLTSQLQLKKLKPGKGRDLFAVPHGGREWQRWAQPNTQGRLALVPPAASLFGPS